MMNNVINSQSSQCLVLSSGYIALLSFILMTTYKAGTNSMPIWYMI